MNSNQTEITLQLDKIADLFSEGRTLESEMIELPPQKKSEANEALEKTFKNLQGFERDIKKKYPLKSPEEPSSTRFFSGFRSIPKSKKKPQTILSPLSLTLGLVAHVVSAISIVLLLMGILFSFILAIIGLVLCVASFIIIAKLPHEDYQHYDWWYSFNKYTNEKISKYFEEREIIHAEITKYQKSYFSIVEECDKKYMQELVNLTNFNAELDEKYAAMAIEIDTKIKEIEAKLEKITVIHSDLFYLAGRISSVLKQGRADTLKEAINIALDDQRKADEELNRQLEAERMEEEARRHNEAMQREAERQSEMAAAQARAAEEQARFAQQQAIESAKQTQLAQQQAEDAKRDAWKRCGRCINSSKCKWDVKGIPNCPNYRPR